MLLMNRTNESGQRQLKPSMLLKKSNSQDFLDTEDQLTITTGTHDLMMSSIQV